MATAKTSNAGPEDVFMLSGTQVRDMLRNGEEIPVEFTRPEVAKILMEDARPKVTA
jgi:sulfate adenylyltransferase